jgi:hypothetical protein
MLITNRLFLHTNAGADPWCLLQSQSFNTVTHKKWFKVLDPPGHKPKTFGPLSYGYIGARTDTTQQSGQTPDKKVEIKNITVYDSGCTESIRLESYLCRLSGLSL